LDVEKSDRVKVVMFQISRDLCTQIPNIDTNAPVANPNVSPNEFPFKKRYSPFK